MDLLHLFIYFFIYLSYIQTHNKQYGMACYAESSSALNYHILFSVPCCLLLDCLIKETTYVMADHLQSRVTPWRQYASHVKVCSTSSNEVYEVWLRSSWPSESNWYWGESPAGFLGASSASLRIQGMALVGVKGAKPPEAPRILSF